MKSKKTKKILGGVAIAAVSLGCLGLAGIANADTTTSTGTMGSSSTGSTTASGAYQLGPMTGAMTGPVTITANISAAQVENGEKLSDHSLEYIQIGSYMTHGSSGSFTVSASTQKVEDALYNFLTASSGGLKQAFPNADYTKANGEAFNWLLTGNSSGTFLGKDASGQAGYGTSENTDYAVRKLPLRQHKLPGDPYDPQAYFCHDHQRDRGWAIYRKQPRRLPHHRQRLFQRFFAHHPFHHAQQQELHHPSGNDELGDGPDCA